MTAAYYQVTVTAMHRENVFDTLVMGGQADPAQWAALLAAVNSDPGAIPQNLALNLSRLSIERYKRSGEDPQRRDMPTSLALTRIEYMLRRFIDTHSPE